MHSLLDAGAIRFGEARQQITQRGLFCLGQVRPLALVDQSEKQDRYVIGRVICQGPVAAAFALAATRNRLLRAPPVPGIRSPRCGSAATAATMESRSSSERPLQSAKKVGVSMTVCMPSHF